jgi:hypothetical protein
MFHGLALTTIAAVLVFAACGGQQDEPQRLEEYPAVDDVEQTATGEPAAQLEPEEPSEEAAEPDPTDPEGEPRAGKGVERPPAAVAPAPDVEQPRMKNWMLIEFARSVEPKDLRWLEENGFRVDTVMSARMVRGWLEEPAGGEAIASDPRIAKIHPQMR